MVMVFNIFKYTYLLFIYRLVCDIKYNISIIQSPNTLHILIVSKFDYYQPQQVDSLVECFVVTHINSTCPILTDRLFVVSGFRMSIKNVPSSIMCICLRNTELYHIWKHSKAFKEVMRCRPFIEPWQPFALIL